MNYLYEYCKQSISMIFFFMLMKKSTAYISSQFNKVANKCSTRKSLCRVINDIDSGNGTEGAMRRFWHQRNLDATGTVYTMPIHLHS